MLLDKWCPRADLNHRHEDFQKRWHYLTQQYQCTKRQKQWCAIYCAIGCHFRPTQKHCVQHRKAAIDWLEMLLVLFTLTWFCKMCSNLFRGDDRLNMMHLSIVPTGQKTIDYRLLSFQTKNLA